MVDLVLEAKCIGYVERNIVAMVKYGSGYLMFSDCLNLQVVGLLRSVESCRMIPGTPQNQP